MRGSVFKHVAKDGTVTWRVRIDYYDAEGQRHQPQRTYATRREAEAGLRRWLIEVEPDRPAEVHRARRSPRHTLQAAERAGLVGPAACLKEIARIASNLQWSRQDLSRQQVTSELRLIEEYAQAGLAALHPEEQPSPSADQPQLDREPQGPYHVYRLLADGVPFYVGQSRNVPSRVQLHIRQALGSKPGRSARIRAIREALANNQTITYDIVASAPTEREILVLERTWIMRMLAEGHTLANGATL